MKQRCSNIFAGASMLRFRQCSKKLCGSRFRSTPKEQLEASRCPRSQDATLTISVRTTWLIQRHKILLWRACAIAGARRYNEADSAKRHALPFTGTSRLVKPNWFFVVDDLGADSELMDEQAALKSVTKEQTASLQTVLLQGTLTWCADPDANRSAGLRPAAPSPTVRTRTGRRRAALRRLGFGFGLTQAFNRTHNESFHVWV